MGEKWGAEIDSAPTPAIPEIVQSFKREIGVISWEGNLGEISDQADRTNLT